MTEQTSPTANESQSAPAAGTAENITGRGVFVVETVAAGGAVRTAFLADDGRLIDIPAVFPDLMYAMAQIDELKQLVARRFAEAAQIGSQVIAQQIENSRAQSQAQTQVKSQPPAVKVSGAQSDSGPTKGKEGTISLSNGSAKSSDKVAKSTTSV
jgi:hypothetical protein